MLADKTISTAFHDLCLLYMIIDPSDQSETDSVFSIFAPSRITCVSFVNLLHFPALLIPKSFISIFLCLF